MIEHVKELIANRMDDRREQELLMWLMDRQWGKMIPSRYVLSPAEKWWRKKLVDGHMLPGCIWAKLTRVPELAEDYGNVVRHQGDSTEANMAAIEKLFDRVLSCLPMPILEPDGPGRWTLCYRFPDLDTCRDSFEAVCGEQDWKPVVEIDTSMFGPDSLAAVVFPASKICDDLGGKW